MGAFKKNVNELLAIKNLDADQVWIDNKVLDALQYRFGAGPEARENWFIEIIKAEAATPDNNNCLCFEGAAAPIWIEDGFTFLGNVTGIFLEQNHLNMVGLLLNRIPAALKNILQCKTLSRQALAGDAYGLVLRYGTDDICFQTRIWTTKSHWINLLSDKRFSPTPTKNNFASLHWNLPVYVGFMTLALTECSKLEQGDLLFFEKMHFSTTGVGNIPLGKLTADVTLEESNNHYQLTIQHWNTTMMTAEEYQTENEEMISEEMAIAGADDDETQKPQSGMQAPIADLPLKLNVKLGSIQFTLEDLSRMVEGKVYPIDSVCPGKVQLMANGIEIARGQLVDVGGKLAVEIQRRWIHA